MKLELAQFILEACGDSGYFSHLSGDSLPDLLPNFKGMFQTECSPALRFESLKVFSMLPGVLMEKVSTFTPEDWHALPFEPIDLFNFRCTSDHSGILIY